MFSVCRPASGCPAAHCTVFKLTRQKRSLHFCPHPTPPYSQLMLPCTDNVCKFLCIELLYQLPSRIYILVNNNTTRWIECEKKKKKTLAWSQLASLAGPLVCDSPSSAGTSQYARVQGKLFTDYIDNNRTSAARENVRHPQTQQSVV